jgi:hypothetical protein
MVLTLANVTVTAATGLAVLSVTEELAGGRSRPQPSYAAVVLVKAAAKEIPAPRDFRPDLAMVDAGTDITLRWQGSDDFTYKIVFPGGQVDIPQGTYSWSPTASEAPQRATTYTLVAASRTTPGQEHFLTTTVHLRHPVLETLTLTTGIDTPWIQGTAGTAGGRVTFTGTGVEISDNAHVRGTVTADRAEFNGINTGWVQGRGTADGKITFPADGLDVRQGNGVAGTVHADRAEVNKVITEQVHGSGANKATITFEEGTEEQEKNVWIRGGVRTDWIRGLNEEESWIRFFTNGIEVRVPPVNSGKKGNVSCASLNGHRM